MKNALPCSSWYEDQNCTELYQLTPFLKALTRAPDVRQILPNCVTFQEPGSQAEDFTDIEKGLALLEAYYPQPNPEKLLEPADSQVSPVKTTISSRKRNLTDAKPKISPNF